MDIYSYNSTYFASLHIDSTCLALFQLKVFRCVDFWAGDTILKLLSLRSALWQLHLKDNPSLHARLEEFISDAYEDSVLLAAKETGLEESAFPSQCPYAQDDLLNPEFYPGLQ